MFIAIVTYKKPLSDVDMYLSAHREYLSRQYEAGNLITSGPQTPRVGDVIMINVGNRDAVNEIIEHDPFYVNGIADYQIVEFTPTKFANDVLKDWLK